MNTTIGLMDSMFPQLTLTDHSRLARRDLPAMAEQDDIVLIGMVVVGRRTADGVEIDAAEFKFLQESELLARLSRRS